MTLKSQKISMECICNLLDTAYAEFVRRNYDMWTTIPNNGGRQVLHMDGKFELHCRPQNIPSWTL